MLLLVLLLLLALLVLTSGALVIANLVRLGYFLFLLIWSFGTFLDSLFLTWWSEVSYWLENRGYE